MPASSHHWKFVATLAKRLRQTTLSLFSYPLTPDCPVSVAMPRLKTLYDCILKQSAKADERVIFAGDSAGGNIVLSLVLWATASNETEEGNCPAGVMVLSPSTDLRHGDAGMKTAAKFDPLLSIPFVNSTAEAWCAGGLLSNEHPAQWSAEDRRVSPILGSLGNLAKHDIQIHGVVGTWDVLAPEAIQFMESCKELGVRGKWLVWEGQMHCFPLAFRYSLSESIRALDWIVRVLQEI